MSKLINPAIAVKADHLEMCQQTVVERVKGLEGICFWPLKLERGMTEAGECYYLF